MNNLLRVLAGIVIFAGIVLPANAQTDGKTGLIVYVYNRKTLRPLSNVDVLYAETLSNQGDGNVVSFGWNPNIPNYQLEVDPTDGALHRYLHAICLTRSGYFTGGADLFANLRAQEYRRDIYIDLPEGEDDCLDQASNPAPIQK